MTRLQRLAAHPGALAALAWLLWAAHAGMAVISGVGRATPPVDITPAPDAIEDLLIAVGDVRWVVLHAAVAVLLLAALVWGRKRAVAAACWMSGTLWALQGVLLGLWSQWSTPPAALVAPWLSLMLGGAATVTGWAWETADELDVIAREG